MKNVAYMAGEAWEDVKAESISKVWRKTLLNRVDQLSGAAASSEWDASAEAECRPEDERQPEDAAVVLEQLREAGFSAGNQEDIQEWLTTDSNEPGHTTLTEEEILETVTLPDCEDDEEDDDDIADESVPSHSEAFTALSTTVRWLEAQDDCDPVSLQLSVDCSRTRRSSDLQNWRSAA